MTISNLPLRLFFSAINLGEQKENKHIIFSADPHAKPAPAGRPAMVSPSRWRLPPEPGSTGRRVGDPPGGGPRRPVHRPGGGRTRRKRHGGEPLAGHDARADAPGWRLRDGEAIAVFVAVAGCDCLQTIFFMSCMVLMQGKYVCSRTKLPCVFFAI